MSVITRPVHPQCPGPARSREPAEQPAPQAPRLEDTRRDLRPAPVTIRPHCCDGRLNSPGTRGSVFSRRRQPRRSKALAALCTELTDTGTRYPGTDLTLAYSIKGHSDPA